MKRIIVLFCLGLATSPLLAQFQDDFSDGDFQKNPNWQGDTSKFQVINGALQLDNAAVDDEAYLSTAVATRDSTTWRCRLALDFAPSNNNRVRVYLQANQANVLGNVQGYFLQIGESGKDDGVDLYRQDGSNTTLLINGIKGTAADDPQLFVEVIRSDRGEWRVWVDTGFTGQMILQGTQTDTTYRSGQYFGVVCTHTSSNHQAFSFDDFFVAPLFVDTLPPTPLQVLPISPQDIEVQFDEAITPASATGKQHFSLNPGNISIVQASFAGNDSSKVLLTTGTPLASPGQYTLYVQNISDRKGNILLEDSLSFTYYRLQKKDVVINEIMANPSPVQGWPDAEWVELYNTAPVPIDIGQWTFSDPNTQEVIPPYTIGPGEYVILVDKAQMGLFPTTLPLVGLSDWPTLNNGGDELSLSSGGLIIDAVSYSDSWYADPDKSVGGYSLELLDASVDCPGPGNWRASLSPTGATPGEENSWAGKYVDTSGPVLAQWQAMDSITYTFTFDEALDTSLISNTSFTISPTVGDAVSWSLLGTQGIQLEVIFAQPLDTGVVYTLTIQGLADCRGNVATNPIAISLLVPEQLEEGDLVINEILANPASGGVDYIEVVNVSSKVVRLQDLRVQEVSLVDGVVEGTGKPLTDLLLRPQEWAAFTSDRTVTLRDYDTPRPGYVLHTDDMPNYPDDEGIVRVVTSQGIMLDSVQYSEEWHYALIDDQNGVSLERILPEGPSNVSDNWISAASAAGFGTPAYENSQFQQLQPFDGEISITPSTVSPDGDGYQDQLTIQYQMDAPGYTATVVIYDAKGRPVNRLRNAALLQQSGTIIWDGLTASGRPAQVGIYIVYIEVFNLDGVVKRFKERCVVARRN